MVNDELAGAEAWMRACMSEETYAVGGETDARELWLIMREYDRRGRVEKAAAALVRHADALLYADGEIGEPLDALLDALSGDAP